MNEQYELDYWKKRFGVSEEDLRDAVRRVGPSIDAVERELKKKALYTLTRVVRHLTGRMSLWFHPLGRNPTRTVFLCAIQNAHLCSEETTLDHQYTCPPLEQ